MSSRQLSNIPPSQNEGKTIPRFLTTRNRGLIPTSHLGVCEALRHRERNELAISIAFRFSSDMRLIVCTAANAIPYVYYNAICM